MPTRTHLGPADFDRIAKGQYRPNCDMMEVSICLAVAASSMPGQCGHITIPSLSYLGAIERWPTRSNINALVALQHGLA